MPLGGTKVFHEHLILLHILGIQAMTMRPLASTVLVALLATAAGVTRPDSDPTDTQSIQGAWEFAPPDESSQRGLLIFTATHYSMMFGRGSDARATYPQDRRMNDEETVVAYNSVTANSGTYTVAGDQVVLTAYVANDPNYMAAWPDNEWTITLRVEGDVITWVDPGYIGLEATMTLRRVE